MFLGKNSGLYGTHEGDDMCVKGKMSNVKTWHHILREVNKYSGVIYRFDVMARNEKIGALEFCDRSSEDARFSMLQPEPEYSYVLASEAESTHALGLGITTRQIHRMYKEIPNYEEVKSDVIDVLSR